METTSVWKSRLPSEAHRTRTRCRARFSMFQEAGRDGRLTRLYIPVSFVVLRRTVLRVALAGTPSAQRWRANSVRHSQSIGFRILRWYSKPAVIAFRTM